MAKARHRKSKKSNNLSYYIVGGLVLVLIIIAFPNIGKFTATLTDNGVEIMLITPDQNIVEAGATSDIKLTFKGVDNFDTLSFTVGSDTNLELTDITFAQGPLTSSNTNIIIGANRATLNYVGEDIADLNVQTLYLHFKNPSSPTQAPGDTHKLNNLVLEDILFGDPDGSKIASFISISEEDALTVAPTVNIISPSDGTHFSKEVGANGINFEISTSSGTIQAELFSAKDETTKAIYYLFEDNKATITAAPGDYVFKVEITNDMGDTTSEQVEFKIEQEDGVEPQPMPPEAEETENLAPDAIIRSPTNNQVFYVGKAITFDATPSTDPDGKIEEVNWAITHQETAEGVLITGDDLEDNNLKFSKALTNAGKYTVEIELLDNDGGSASARAEIEIISIGDINGDGQITGADVTASEWLSVGVDNNYVVDNADANQDENTDSLDISAIEQIVLK